MLDGLEVKRYVADMQLLKWRLRQGWTLRDMAEKLSDATCALNFAGMGACSPSTVMRWEKGTGAPSLVYALAILHVTHRKVTLRDLAATAHRSRS